MAQADRILFQIQAEVGGGQDVSRLSGLLNHLGTEIQDVTQVTQSQRQQMVAAEAELRRIASTYAVGSAEAQKYAQLAQKLSQQIGRIDSAAIDRLVQNMRGIDQAGDGAVASLRQVVQQAQAMRAGLAAGSAEAQRLDNVIRSASQSISRIQGRGISQLEQQLRSASRAGQQNEAELRQVAQAARQMASGFAVGSAEAQRLAAIAGRAEQELEQLEEAARQAAQASRQIGQGAAGAAGGFTKLQAGIVGLSAGLMVIEQVGQAVGALENRVEKWAQQADAAATSQRSWQTVMERFNVDAKEADAVFADLSTRTGATEATLKGAAGQFIKMGGTLEEFRMGALAASSSWYDLTDKTITLDDAINNVTLGLATGRSELMESSGIVVNASDAWKKYADSVGKSVDDLSDAEKAHAYTLAVYKEEQIGIETLADKQTDLTVAQREQEQANRQLGNTMGQIVLPYYTQWVQQSTEVTRAVTNVAQAVLEGRDPIEALAAAFPGLAGEGGGAMQALMDSANELRGEFETAFAQARSYYDNTLVPMWEEIAPLVGSAVGQVVPLVGSLVELIGNAFALMEQAWVSIGKPMWDTWGPTAQAAVEMVGQWLNFAVDVVSGIFAAIAAMMRGDWGGAWKIFEDTVEDSGIAAWDSLKNFSKNFDTSMNTMVDSAIEKAGKIGAGIKDGISNALMGLGELLIRRMEAELAQYTDWMPDWLKEKLGIGALQGGLNNAGDYLNQAGEGARENQRQEARNQALNRGYWQAEKNANQITGSTRDWNQQFIRGLASTFKNDPLVDSDCAIIASKILRSIGVNIESSVNAGVLEQNALKAGGRQLGVGANAAAQAQTGDLVTWSSDLGSRSRSFGKRSGKHSGVVVGRDAQGNLWVINNPGSTNTQVEKIYNVDQASFIRFNENPIGRGGVAGVTQPKTNTQAPAPPPGGTPPNTMPLPKLPDGSKATADEVKRAGLTVEEWNKHGPRAVAIIKQVAAAEASANEAWIISARNKAAAFAAEGEAQRDALAFAKERNKVSAPDKKAQEQYNFSLADWNKHQKRALELARELKKAEDSNNTVRAQQVREIAAAWYGNNKAMKGAFDFAQTVLKDQEAAAEKSTNASQQREKEAQQRSAAINQARIDGNLDAAKNELTKLGQMRENDLRAAGDNAQKRLEVEQRYAAKIRDAKVAVAQIEKDKADKAIREDKNLTPALRQKQLDNNRDVFNLAKGAAESEYKATLQDATDKVAAADGQAAKDLQKVRSEIAEKLRQGRVEDARLDLAELERLRDRAIDAAGDDAGKVLAAEKQYADEIYNARKAIADRQYEIDMRNAAQGLGQLRADAEARALRVRNAAYDDAEDERNARLERANTAVLKQTQETADAIARIQQASTQEAAKLNLDTEKDSLEALNRERDQALRAAGDNLAERSRLTREYADREVQQLQRVAAAQLVVDKRSNEAQLAADLKQIEDAGATGAEKQTLIDDANALSLARNAAAYRTYFTTVGEAARLSGNTQTDAARAVEEALRGKDGQSGLVGAYTDLAEEAEKAGRAGGVTAEQWESWQDALDALDLQSVSLGLDDQTQALSDAARATLDYARILSDQRRNYEASAEYNVQAATRTSDRGQIGAAIDDLMMFQAELLAAADRGENVGDALLIVDNAIAALTEDWDSFMRGLSDTAGAEAATLALQNLSSEALDAAYAAAEAAQDRNGMERLEAEVVRRNELNASSAEVLQGAQRQLAEMLGQEAVPAWEELARQMDAAASAPGLNPQLKTDFQELAADIREAGAALDDYNAALQVAATENGAATQQLDRDLAAGVISQAEYFDERERLQIEAAHNAYEQALQGGENEVTAAAALQTELTRIERDGAAEREQFRRSLEQRRREAEFRMARSRLDAARAEGLDLLVYTQGMNDLALLELEENWAATSATLQEGSDEYLAAYTEYLADRQELTDQGNRAIIDAEKQLWEERTQLVRDWGSALGSVAGALGLDEAAEGLGQLGAGIGSGMEAWAKFSAGDIAGGIQSALEGLMNLGSALDNLIPSVREYKKELSELAQAQREAAGQKNYGGIANPYFDDLQKDAAVREKLASSNMFQRFVWNLFGGGPKVMETEAAKFKTEAAKIFSDLAETVAGGLTDTLMNAYDSGDWAGVGAAFDKTLDNWVARTTLQFLIAASGIEEEIKAYAEERAKALEDGVITADEQQQLDRELQRLRGEMDAVKDDFQKFSKDVSAADAFDFKGGIRSAAEAVAQGENPLAALQKFMYDQMKNMVLSGPMVQKYVEQMKAMLESVDLTGNPQDIAQQIQARLPAMSVQMQAELGPIFYGIQAALGQNTAALMGNTAALKEAQFQQTTIVNYADTGRRPDFRTRLGGM